MPQCLTPSLRAVNYICSCQGERQLSCEAQFGLPAKGLFELPALPLLQGEPWSEQGAPLLSHRYVWHRVLRQAGISDGYLKISSCNCRRTGTMQLPHVKPICLTEHLYQRQHLTKCSHGKSMGHFAPRCLSVEGNEQIERKN